MCDAVGLVDKAQIDPGRGGVPHLLLLRQQPNALLESLAVCDVAVPEALVAEVRVQCDQEIVILGIFNRPEGRGQVAVVLRQALGHVLEYVGADVLPAVESLMRNDTLDVEEPVLPDRVGVDGDAVVPLDEGSGLVILAQTPEDFSVVQVPFDDVSFDLLPADHDGTVKDDQDMRSGITVGLGLLADQLPVCPEDLGDIGVE